MSASLERRRSPRVAVRQTGLESARFVGGAAVRVKDLSRGGAAVVGRQRAAPGRNVVLQWTVGHAPVRLAARVVRSVVAALSGEAGVEYLVAVEFSAAADALWELTTRTG